VGLEEVSSASLREENRENEAELPLDFHEIFVHDPPINAVRLPAVADCFGSLFIKDVVSFNVLSHPIRLVWLDNFANPVRIAAEIVRNVSEFGEQTRTKAMFNENRGRPAMIAKRYVGEVASKGFYWVLPQPFIVNWQNDKSGDFYTDNGFGVQFSGLSGGLSGRDRSFHIFGLPSLGLAGRSDVVPDFHKSFVGDPSLGFHDTGLSANNPDLNIPDHDQAEIKQRHENVGDLRIPWIVTLLIAFGLETSAMYILAAGHDRIDGGRRISGGLLFCLGLLFGFGGPCLIWLGFAWNAGALRW
jgi:hypothetical protein